MDRKKTIADLSRLSEICAGQEIKLTSEDISSIKFALDSLKTDEAYQLEYEKREIKEIVPAHWIHVPENERYKEQWVCSNCHHGIIENPKFTSWITGESIDFVWCPICGAKMDEDEKNGTDSKRENR